MTLATHMQREILEIPDVVERLLTEGRDEIEAAAAVLRERAPAFLVTVARGSSDHAATVLKYATELTAGIPVASAGPSIVSVYGKELKLAQGACVSISQSGKSPDIVRLSEMARRQGAPTIVLTNNPESDLAKAASAGIFLRAGHETSVAATKTFVASLAASLGLLAEWQDDGELRRALRDLPQHLARATEICWDALADAVLDSGSAFCLGRGANLGAAAETALKFKETCGLHAEAYSAAEVLHGPVAIVGPGFPVLALASGDQAEASVAGLADELADKGASVFATTQLSRSATPLPVVRTGHALCDPLASIVSFYVTVEQLARARGFDPDRPAHLRKVTETV